MLYEVVIESVHYGASVLDGITLSQSIGNFGLSGTSTACLSFKLYSASEATIFEQGQGVSFFSNGTLIMQGQIVDVSRSEGVFSITAYDMCYQLDQEYDMSGKAQYETDQQTHQPNKARPNWWDTSQIVSEIAVACGLSGQRISFSPVRETKSSTDKPTSTAQGQKLCYNDINGKSCRQILDDLSSVECGYFFSSAGGILSFNRFDAPTSASVDMDALIPSTTTRVHDHEHTEICIQGKRLIAGCYAVDGVTGEERVSGSTDPYQRVDISSRYMTADNFSDASSDIMTGAGASGAWYMTGWHVDKVADSGLSAGTEYALGSTIKWQSNYLRVIDRTVYFGPEITYSLSASKPETTMYITKQERAIKQGIAIDKINGNATRISRSGGIEAVSNKTTEKGT